MPTKQFGVAYAAATTPLDGNETLSIVQGGVTVDCTTDDIAALASSGSGDVVGPLSSVSGNIATFSGTTGKIIQDGGTTTEKLRTQSIVIASSDETTNLTVGTAKVTFRMPYAFTLVAVRASLTTAQTTGAIFTVDINENGTSILSTKLTIDNNELTSTTAAIQAVISDSLLSDDSQITVDIDQIGTAGAKGLKVSLIGYVS